MAKNWQDKKITVREKPRPGKASPELLKTLRAIEKTQFAPIPKSPWQSIDTAPKDGTKVLLCDDRQATVAVAGYSKHYGFWLSGANVITEPTHWMSIPAIPCQLPLKPQA